MTTRDDALALDAADPLAGWRDEFVIPDPDVIYLDGNSLGRTPKRTVAALHRVIEQWSGDLIASWWEHDWLDLALTVGDELAPLLGARPGEVVVQESTTVGLFQQVNVALDLVPGRRVIAIADDDFPTDRYVVNGVARLRSCAVRRGLDDLDGVGVVVRSLVDYRTAEVADLAVETARAAAAGATTIWDLSHAVGVLELDLPGAGVELAVGCSYKYLNGGPGAPGFVYVSASVQDRLTQPIWGWFAQTEQFAMDRPFDPRPGVGRMLNGTPPVLGLTAARAGIGVTVDAGIAAIADKARALTGFCIELADELEFETDTPRDPDRRGGHVAIRHRDARRLQQALSDHRVIVDYRDPDVLRLGLSPLTTSFADVFDAMSTLARLSRLG
ncbi:MAG TPA: aminotransferase class V-fold PLP-dependent enzyme [Ilumatobacteraceae bacterium]|nr:aminotransferase class V-fold PLP-dependent enzyme [Ilumatobacteraceae bacterium]